MKNNFLILLCVLSFSIRAQSFVLGVDTLLKSGPISKRINLVFMGDGYTTAEMPQFLLEATKTYTYLLNTPPFNNYKNYFNVFAIKCQSPQSGVSHPANATDVTEPVIPYSFVNDCFTTRFDNSGIHRLIYSTNTGSIYYTLANNFPNYDQVVILGNSPEYGGAGGAYAVSSTHSSSREIVAHEIGHSFAGLADEYWPGPQYASEKPNLTAENSPGNVKWAEWLGTNGIGVYPHGTSAPESGWFRPHQNCKMRYLNQPFCSVCKETIIEKIHSITNPIDSYSPTASALTVSTSSQWFKTSLVKPNPNTLKTTWTLNGTELLQNQDSILLSNTVMVSGNNSLIFTAVDTNTVSRDLYHPFTHAYSIVWAINNAYVGVNEIAATIEYAIYPNPATDKVNLNYRLLKDSQISISVADMNGKTVIKGKQIKQVPGEYNNEISLNELSSGTYFLNITLNSQIINHKFIVVK